VSAPQLPEPQVARTADRLRDEFLVTLRELDRRAHRAMDVRGLLRDNRRVVIAAGAGLAAVVVVIIGTSVALSHSRHSRLPELRMHALRRAWDRPDRIASRPRPTGFLLILLKAAAMAAGTQLVRRGVQRALAAVG
jgi:drug/metabolite transporter (DMT)-like permease